MPYTYLIGWPEHNLYYYGVRYAMNCHPGDLWKTYFTSSKYVAETRKALGEPSLVSVRKTFSDGKIAAKWETRVLTRINAAKHEKFLNRTNIPAAPQEKTPEQIDKIAAKLKGQKRTPEQRQNIANGRLNGKSTLPKSDETKRRMSKGMKGKAKPEGFGALVSARMKGRVQSEEERMKRKQTLTGKKKSPEHIAAIVAAKKKNRELKLLLANG